MEERIAEANQHPRKEREAGGRPSEGERETRRKHVRRLEHSSSSSSEGVYSTNALESITAIQDGGTSFYWDGGEQMAPPPSQPCRLSR